MLNWGQVIESGQWGGEGEGWGEGKEEGRMHYTHRQKLLLKFPGRVRLGAPP